MTYSNIIALIRRLSIRHYLLVVLPALILTSCSNQQQTNGAPKGAISISVWFHSGQAGERKTMQEQVARFNGSQGKIHVQLTIIPEGTYNPQVQAAALAGDLPDLLEFDGPYLYNYVWQGHLQPLDDLLPEELRNDLLPTILEQGTYNNHLYSIGTFDSGLGLFARLSKLAAAGVRIPLGIDDAWTGPEFDRVLTALAEQDPDGAILDLKLNYRGEWYTYAFSPILHSAGTELLDPKSMQHAAGFLNSGTAVTTMSRLQAWLQKGYVDANVDDASFVSNRVALSWVGHWEYPRYREACGDDLILLPLPDFGNGSKSGQGSWNWGITTNSRHPKEAFAFLHFILTPDEVLSMATANGAVPARRSVLARSPLYRPGGPLNLFAAQLLQGHTVSRPRTPAYPVISAAFQQAFDNIRNNGDARDSLDNAARTIDQDISDNRGYAAPLTK
jgi:multiple sugar transport system substrate-binding protein